MAVTVVKRPLGHILDTTENSACIWDDYGSALVVAPGHGLIDGDYVYIKSNVSNYNGFWYVVFNNGSSFYIREYPTASNVEGVVDTCDVVYQYSVQDHGFQCVHLPIIYKISSDRWPTNNVDTTRSISSITDDNGLCNLNLSGSLGTFDELEYVKILDNEDFPDEVYQVINKVSASDITINRAYEAGLTTGTSIVIYYNNYTVYVRVHAGLRPLHYWKDEKPVEVVTTLKVTPDNDNIATINIAEILKTKISPTENSTLSLALPNNIDFFTNFYISVGETYDDAVNGEVVESEVSYTSDSSNFKGSAVNSMLPFKNKYSGHLSEYIYGDSNNLIKFLNLFNPIFYSGEYFDVSFINNITTSANTVLRIKRDVYIDDVLKETFYDDIGNRSEGVYRKQIERSGWSEDRIDLTIEANALLNPILPGNWFNSGSGSTWTITVDEIRTSTSSTSTAPIILPTKKVVTLFAITSGNTYRFKVNQTATLGSYSKQSTGGANNQVQINIYLRSYNSSVVQVDSTTIYTITTTSDGSFNIQIPFNSIFSLTASGDAAYIGFEAELIYTNTSAPSSNLVTLSILLYDILEIDTIIPISETKTITVNDKCSDQYIYLGWLNYLGGFEYWKFTARKDYQYEVEKSKITEKNIYTNWPSSYGEFANSITKQIARNSREKIFVRSQFLTKEQLEGIKFIRFSPLVQIVEDKYNVTNVVVDSGSFTTFRDAQDMFTLEFTISFTDRIPAQFE